MIRQYSMFSQETESEHLFAEKVELIKGVTWSYSRRGILEQCPRKYYYQYFGASTRKAKEDSNKADLRFLKTLQNRHERAGEILHLVIASGLRKLQRGESLDADRLVSWGIQLFQKDGTYSKAAPDGNEVMDEPYPPHLLREFHYRLPDADVLFDTALKRLSKALTAFARSKEFSSIRAAVSVPGALIEQHITVPQLPCRVEGRVDVAFVSDQGVSIVDWKTGGPEGGEDSLQLVAYALWAGQHFSVKPEQVRVHKAFLGDERVQEYQLDKPTIDRGRARILQDVERMTAFDAYGQSGRDEVFPTAPSAKLCGLCAFQKLCPAGKEYLQ